MSLITLLFIGLSPVLAQHQMKARVSPHDTLVAKNIKITYGRPYVKGREIFGALEPYGKVWRAGADEATEVTFNAPCMIAGIPVKAGTYSMFVIPDKTRWTLIFNSELGQWGAFGYDKIKDKDVVKVSLPITQLSKTVEQLTITVDENKMQLSWDKTSVDIPLMFASN
jgi:Protein of unknown function (DUF2911)